MRTSALLVAVALGCGGGLPRGTVTIQGQTIEVEVAATPEDRRQGLMGRSELEPGRGMLFLHGSLGRHAYWMKDMSFAIDIVWISGDRIVDVSHRVPPSPPGTPDAEREHFRGRVPYDRVLEVPAGYARAHGLEPGERVAFELPASLSDS